MSSSETATLPYLIIGAGLAGLSCAVRLHENGFPVQVLEKSDGVGGRVRTDQKNGFLLDRGFQVYLDAYPEAGEFLDLEALDLQPFEPGALVWRKGKLREVMDVFRHPSALFSSALQPIGSPIDKLLVAKLRFRLLRKPMEEIWATPEQTTADYLRDFGFSESMIDLFFRGFYGGIFLEDLLVTSSRMFEFTFKMFAEGRATLPARGMQRIPEQLAARLPKGAVETGREITSLESRQVSGNGFYHSGRGVILATDGSSTSALLDRDGSVRWNSTACLYFSTDSPPLARPIIALKGDREGLVNNVSVPTAVSSQYGDKPLVSVSVLGDQRETPDLEEAVRAELRSWFGPSVDHWTHEETYHVRKALPTKTSGHLKPVEKTPEGIYVCGDANTSGSIEGAILSGLRTADHILEESHADPG